MSIKERLLNVLGAAPRNAFNEIDIKFYKDCLHDVPHGMLVVTNKVQKLNQVAVPFVFPGMGEPPVLTARLMQDIWSAAESQGYVPHYLLPLTYGLHQSQEVEEHPTAASDAAASLAHLDRVLTPLVNTDKVPAVRRQEVTLAGVTTEDILSFKNLWKSEQPRANEVFGSIKPAERQVLTGMLEDRIAMGFVRREKVGVIYAALNGVLDDYMKNNPRQALQPGGLPIALSTLREQTTEDQQENMEALVDANVTDEQLAFLNPPQVDELKSRVLLSISNDQARSLEDYAVNANALEVIRAFLQINLPDVSLKFPRAANKGAGPTVQ